MDPITLTLEHYSTLNRAAAARHGWQTARTIARYGAVRISTAAVNLIAHARQIQPGREQTALVSFMDALRAECFEREQAVPTIGAVGDALTDDPGLSVLDERDRAAMLRGLRQEAPGMDDWHLWYAETRRILARELGEGALRAATSLQYRDARDAGETPDAAAQLIAAQLRGIDGD